MRGNGCAVAYSYLAKDHPARADAHPKLRPHAEARLHFFRNAGKPFVYQDGRPTRPERASSSADGTPKNDIRPSPVNVLI